MAAVCAAVLVAAAGSTAAAAAAAAAAVLAAPAGVLRAEVLGLSRRAAAKPAAAALGSYRAGARLQAMHKACWTCTACSSSSSCRLRRAEGEGAGAAAPVEGLGRRWQGGGGFHSRPAPLASRALLLGRLRCAHMTHKTCPQRHAHGVQLDNSQQYHRETWCFVGSLVGCAWHGVPMVLRVLETMMIAGASVQDVQHQPARVPPVHAWPFLGPLGGPGGPANLTNLSHPSLSMDAHASWDAMAVVDTEQDSSSWLAMAEVDTIEITEAPASPSRGRHLGSKRPMPRRIRSSFGRLRVRLSSTAIRDRSDRDRPWRLRTVVLIALVVVVAMQLWLEHRRHRQLAVWPNPPLPSPSMPPAVPENEPQRPPPPPLPPPSPPLGPCACRNRVGSRGFTVRTPPQEAAHAQDVCFDPDAEGAREWSTAYMYVLRCFNALKRNGLNAAAYAQATACLTPRRQWASQRALFLFGDSHAAALTAGVARAVRGRMAFAWMARAGCAYTPVQTQCPAAYRAHITSMLRSQLRRGDVVCVTGAGDVPLMAASLAWYESFLLPLLRSKGAALLLLRDVLPMYQVLLTSALLLRTPPDRIGSDRPLSSEHNSF